MANRGRPGGIACALAVAALAGCGAEPSREIPTRCKASAEIERAERISPCFVAGADAGDVQALGYALLPVVRRERDVERLGFLIGAVRRGAAKGKVYGELLRRVEQELAGVDTSSPAFRRGERAGRERG